MTEEVYKKAKQLQSDMDFIRYQLKKKKEDKHWITISTPHMKEACGSNRFQNELVDWLEQKVEEYQEEFAELGCE